MPTIEDLRSFGAEIRRRRAATGARSLRAFAREWGISPTHLSQIERAYVHPKRGYIVPSDEMLDKLSAGLEIPVSRLHAMLGRMPDVSALVFSDPEIIDLAERYDRMPRHARTLLRNILADIEAMVAEQTASGAK